MNDELVKKYRHYAASSEAFAVLFVKKYLRAAAEKWVDILDFEIGVFNNMQHLEFKFVKCELFEKKIRPKYPPKKNFYAEGDYIIACRAITWETAHKDIQQQRSGGVKGKIFILRGSRIQINTAENVGDGGFFRDDAPDEIKALAKNLNDRTDPLWDKALQYIRKPNNEYRYELTSVKRI